MKFDHTDEYSSKFDSETFDIEYSFNSELATGETVASAVVTCLDVNGNDKTASMISAATVITPDVYFTVSDGTVGMLYSIKILATSTTSMVYAGFVNCEVFGSLTLNTKLGDPTANSYATLQEANNYVMNKYGHTNKWDTLTSEGKKRVLMQAAIDIDSMNFKEDKYYAAQAMEFPRDDHTVVKSDCASPFTINSFLNSNLYSDTYNKYPANYWKYGSCHIVEGTPLYNIRVVATSSATNGQVTLSEDFSATPNSDTDFIIFTPLSLDIKYAQIEQAIYILQTYNMQTLREYKILGSERVKIGDVEVQFKRSSSDSNISTISPLVKILIGKYTDRNYKVYRA